MDAHKPLKPIWTGDTIALGNRALEVIHLPGHTPGSIALLDRKNKCIFTGDAVSAHPVFMFGPGRNLEAYIESMKKLESYAGGFQTVYTCHGSMELSLKWITLLTEGAVELLAGKLEGAPPPWDLPCKHYRYKEVSFFY